MHLSSGPVIFILALLSLLTSTSQSCSETFLQMIEKKKISHCKKLITLGAEFGWNYDNQNESRIDIFFGTRQHPEMQWLAWGVNPWHRPQMVGTEALIGIVNSNGSLVIDTYNITIDTKLGCTLQPSEIDVEVQQKEFEYMDSTGFFTMYAKLILPRVYNISKLNHVWQVGYYAEGMEPKMHRTTLQNVDSRETIDLKTGVGSQGVGEHRYHLRMMHGILNIVGWGTLLPIGVIIARYFRNYPRRSKSWFSLHVTCQIVGYIIGTTGFAIGLWLGEASKHYSFHHHRLLSIIIFTFITLQMFALRLRPKASDEYRKYWNMYHHFLGYALLVVISANIFQGIAILKPDQTWKWAYIGVVGILVFILMAFEVYTWTKFLTTKESPEQKQNQSSTTSSAAQSSSTTSAARSGQNP